MLTPEAMARVDILALAEDAEPITRSLAAAGSLHLAAPAGRQAPADGAPDECAELAGLAEALLKQLACPPAPADGARREAILALSREAVLRDARAELDSVRSEIDAAVRRLDERSSAIRRLDSMSEELHLLNEHGLAFSDIGRFDHIHAAYGTVSREGDRRLAARLEGRPCAVLRRPVGDDVSILLLGDPQSAGELDALLGEAGFRVHQIPARYQCAPDEALDLIEMDLWQARDELADLRRRFDADRKAWAARLSYWLAALRIHRRLALASAGFAGTPTAAMISGHVPLSRRDALLGRLERDCRGRYVLQADAADDAREIVPTKLRNAGPFRPFELLVRTYGLPRYRDLDPTPFVAVSFLAMYGMMFGDVGHGAVLAAIGLTLAFVRVAAFAAFRDLGKVVAMAGMSGVLFGFLFGSVFGIEEDGVLPALWMRPSHPENLPLFLYAALGLGAAIVSLGIVLAVVQAVRRRDWTRALVGQWSAASLVFYWGLLALMALQLAGRPVTMPPGAVAALLAAPLLCIVGGQLLARHSGAGEAHGGHGPELATLLFEPIEVLMNLFANSVSFLRVAAFGLAHAALTAVTFIVKDLMPGAGTGFLTLPLEHLLIIALEGMVVTIQCLRLEYYEFFSKFFNGDGVEYAPLSARGD